MFPITQKKKKRGKTVKVFRAVCNDVASRIVNRQDYLRHFAADPYFEGPESTSNDCTVMVHRNTERAAVSALPPEIPVGP